MDSFFKSLKTERTDRKTDRILGDAKADVFGCIDVFHNGKRRHSTVGYVSPIQFEQQVQQLGLVSTEPAAVHYTWCRRLRPRPQALPAHRFA